jgi:hypothetical protein
MCAHWNVVMPGIVPDDASRKDEAKSRVREEQERRENAEQTVWGTKKTPVQLKL